MMLLFDKAGMWVHGHLLLYNLILCLKYFKITQYIIF